MGRAPCCEKEGLRRGAWSPEEDQRLVAYIRQHGHPNWRALPRQAGLLRCGKSCRLRWINYLRPDIKRGNFSADEEALIVRLHRELGNRSAPPACHLPFFSFCLSILPPGYSRFDSHSIFFSLPILKSKYSRAFLPSAKKENKGIFPGHRKGLLGGPALRCRHQQWLRWERYSPPPHIFSSFFVRLLSLRGGHSRLETITYPPPAEAREDKSPGD
jgi:hypothetical protein